MGMNWMSRKELSRLEGLAWVKRDEMSLRTASDKMRMSYRMKRASISLTPAPGTAMSM
jgi:hypothetical protein